MGKMDRRPEATRHLHQIEVGTNAIGAGAQGQAIGRARHSLEQPLGILGTGHYPRQSEQRPRRIVGMNGHAHARLFGDRDDRLEKVAEVLAEDIGIDLA